MHLSFHPYFYFMKLITLFLLLLPFGIVAQDLCVTYECYIVKIEDNNSAKIYHLDSKVTVTDNSILVTLNVNDNEKDVVLFEQPTLHWTVGVDYLEYSGDSIIRYYPKVNNLVIINNKNLSETTFYGTIPSLIEIRK